MLNCAANGQGLTGAGKFLRLEIHASETRRPVEAIVRRNSVFRVSMERVYVTTGSHSTFTLVDNTAVEGGGQSGTGGAGVT